MKKKTIQRAFAWALTLVMVLSAAPLGVFAEGENEEPLKCVCTVKCGETVNKECPVCSENAEKCAVTTQKQEDEGKEGGGADTLNKNVESPSGGEGGSTGNDTTKSGSDKNGSNKNGSNNSNTNDNNTNDSTNNSSTNNSGANNNNSNNNSTNNSTGGGKTSDQPSGSGDGTSTGTGSGSSGIKGTPSGKDGEGSGGSGTGGNTGNETEKKTFSISFDVQGHGAAQENMTTGEDGKLTSELPQLTEEGFTFGGWYLDEECSDNQKVEESHPFTENTTLYAKWTENPATGITVTFDFQDVSIPKEQKKVNADGKLDGTLPTPSKTGYDFLYWYLNAEDSKEQKVTNETKFTQDTTVYAKWQIQPQAVTVTFDPNGGECGVTSATVNKDNKLGNLPNPTLAGHEFLGWYIQNTDTKVSLDTTYDAPTTLEARWVVLDKPDYVTLGENFLNENSEKLKPDTDKVEIRVKEGSKTRLDEISNKLGDKLDGKKLLAVYDLSVYMIIGSEHQPLTPVTGLIRFDFPVTGNVAAVYHNTDPMPVSDGSKAGYLQNGSTLTIWANSFSPYAIVTDGYQITLDARGGTLGEGISNSMTTDPDGILKNLPKPPTKTGYTFGGWYRSTEYKDADKVEAGAKFESNATIYAKWTPITYDVVFHDNYRTPEKTDTQTLTYDKEERLSYDETKIKREYYQLDGWAETSDGEIVYGTNNPVKNLCSQQGAEKHLYAVWSYQRKTVIFDADGGKIKKDGKEEQQVTVFTQESPINTVKAKEVPVPMTREGYYFGGWYTDKDGKGDLVKPDKTEFTKERTTVYAYWIEFKPVTVTFKCQGGTARIGSTDVKEFTMQTKWPGVLDGTPTTPSRSSYKFEGWYTAAGVKVDEDTLFLKDATVYARWKRAVSITGNPRTGDQVKLEAAIAILAAAAIGLGATVVLKKRKDK